MVKFLLETLTYHKIMLVILKVQRIFFTNFLIKLCLEMFDCPVTDCSSRIAKIQEDYCLKKHLKSYHSLKVDKVRKVIIKILNNLID